MQIKPGQRIGVEMPEGQRALTVPECFRLMDRPGMRDAVELACRADIITFEDGSQAHPESYAILEMARGSRPGKFIETDNKYAEKVAAEKRRLANSC